MNFLHIKKHFEQRSHNKGDVKNTNQKVWKYLLCVWQISIYIRAEEKQHTTCNQHVHRYQSSFVTCRNHGNERAPVSNQAQSRHLKPTPMQNTMEGVLVPLNTVEFTQLEVSHVSERVNMMDVWTFIKSIHNTSLDRVS